MRLGTWALSFLFVCLVRGSQIPLRRPSAQGTAVQGEQTSTAFRDYEEWDTNIPPDSHSTSRFIFDNVGSMMQHWPNTRYRNGHNVVPATIPTGTLLYHARSDKWIPTTPDWTATDPEHSYPFCQRECWHLTLITMRPLKLLYFDGSSAAKMIDGAMDSQDIILWGETKPDKVFNEQERLNLLCEWGKEFNLDGFVRMEMDFEIMLCDFTAGLEVVSFDQLIPVTIPTLPVPGGLDFIFEVIHAGSWHNYYPGDARVNLDISRLVSFYDTSLAPSLRMKRHGLERLKHRLTGIDSKDVDAIRDRLADVLRPDTRPSSGVDWLTLVRVTVDRFGERLELLKDILDPENFDTFSSIRDVADKAQNQFRIMLTPYILTSITLPNWTAWSSSEDSYKSSWFIPVYKRCATVHTSHIRIPVSRAALSERTLLTAVRDVNREICSIVTNLWVEGVLVGLDTKLIPDHVEKPSISKLHALVERWREKIDGLMKWLDWSMWIRCKPACNFEEICYLPTWPFFRQPDNSTDDNLTSSNERVGRWNRLEIPFLEGEWEDPQPRCIRRIGPYGV